MSKAKTAPKSKQAKTEQPAAAGEMRAVYKKLKTAYSVGCSIVSLSTSDPAQTIRDIIETLDKCAVITWDCAVGGHVPAQKNQAEAKVAEGKIDMKSLSLTDFLVSCQAAPGRDPVQPESKGTVIVIKNAHRFLDAPEVVQAVWNLRDPFKSPKRMLILLGPSIRIPAELQHDVIEIDEPLPDTETLKGIVENVAAAVSFDMEPESVEDAAAACQGLSAFAAEQLSALNLSRENGISVRGVWGDKCAKINETPGLRVISGGSFADVAGVEQIKKFLSGILNGRDKPRSIVFVDEIEKSMGGAAGDTSGVSQDQLGVLLQYMQDKRASGVLLLGHPGVAKSAIAKTAGGEVGIPTVQFDLGGMKDSLVGGSEQRIREALKVIDAISGGQTLWVATCNNLTVLPPELRRRFKFGTWFFDMPTLDERKAIWTLYCDKYDLPAPDHNLLSTELTGAEIESCCDIAWRMGISTTEASGYISPISQAHPQQIEGLRKSAEDKFLSASYPGRYRMPSSNQTQASGRIVD